MVVSDDEPHVHGEHRVHYALRDEEAGHGRGAIAEHPCLPRQSTSAVNSSARSGGQRKRSNKLAMPIAYRTL